MKTILLKLLILFTLLPFSYLQATHIVGGEMTYVCLGNGDYEITLKIYRNCESQTGFDGPFNGAMSIYKGESEVEFGRITMPSPVVTPIPPDINNPCLILPPNICVEEGLYQFNLSDDDIGNINLPLSDESYHIIYQRCCRNNTISNILNPESTGATFYIEITGESQSLCNSTPTFDNFPPIVICVNEDLVFDHSATDPDGDLLVYELCSPLKGGGLAGWMGPGNASDFDGTNPNPDAPPPFDNVIFVGPTYQATDPIGGNPILTINPTTGLLTGTPNTEGQFVVGICVDEYRNGVLLSRVQRDFQFNIAFCEPTVVAEVNGDYFGGADSLFQFENCNGDTTLSFQAPQSQFISDYEWQFDLGGVSPLGYNEPNIDVEFPGYGTYNGVLMLNPGSSCGDTALFVVEIYEPPTANFSSDYDTCVAGTVTFTDLSISTAFHDISNWSWDFGDGQTATEQNPELNYTDPGTYNVTLQITDENGCEDEITQPVVWLPVPPLIIIEPSSFSGCPPLDVFFNNLSTPIDDTYDIVWDFGDGGTSQAISPSYTYLEEGTYSIYVGITSPIGCFVEKTFPDLIKVDSFPIADFSFGPDHITNFEPETHFNNESIRDVAWQWDFNGYGTSFMENPIFSFPDTGLQVVELIVTTATGCKDTIQKTVDVIPEIRYFLPNAFTPNDDDLNDEFRSVGFYRGMKDYNFKVWNRWGEMIFETNDPEEGWNGKWKNKFTKMPVGVYVYQVKYREPRGVPHELQGFITLVK